MVLSERSCSSCWPRSVVKNDASGVPWWGVETVTTVRTRAASRSTSTAVGSSTPGAVSRRTSSPPLEWPIRWSGPPPRRAVAAIASATRAARVGSEAVGGVRTMWMRASSPSAAKRSPRIRRTCPK